MSLCTLLASNVCLSVYLSVCLSVTLLGRLKLPEQPVMNLFLLEVGTGSRSRTADARFEVLSAVS